MDLRSGKAFWPIQNGLIRPYPPLQEHQTTDVVVLGGGITGALVAWHLTRAGIDCVVLDRRDVAFGSTSASTAILQYEIDTPLTQLSRLLGEEHAARAYLLCLKAIRDIETLCHELGEDVGFQPKHSLYFASKPADVRGLQREHALRRKHGIQVDFWDEEEISRHFPFRKSAALYSQTAAEVDPYRLCHALLKAATKKGLRVFDRTEAQSWDTDDSGVTVRTDRGFDIRASKMVFATGYEAQSLLRQKVVRLRNSYALVSEPVTEFTGWHEKALIWETARPYLYARTTQDGRIMMGGEDETFRTLPIRERRIPGKQARLEEKFRDLFPEIPLETAFAWAGTFGETRDGLAYIGEHPDFPKAYFALGYGGNGITYSLLAAQMIRDMILKGHHPDWDVFRFDR
ncbi:NAD(P)/FAD-dependent oxidoreductase [Deinococcus cellulosilyticus]|uniref:Oxidoreductase n=1 Tax=Deinococcus cellulosilyticus (strain DSM 18568 / NBRC 106333 / KACC 11606 / 5516J-15) TaxID=1223518 RepID=A0A511N2T1_DEIC1|nr:FAD-dependent oxidoreductase [Deinococcus cellulosilyticus]GEM47152.1 oxidoreductase [Deinococcus cellulosilyticus NBRC 106333 = KACC 11606]